MEDNVEEITDHPFFIPGYTDANSYSQAALRSILLATKASNELPTADNDFNVCDLYPGFREVLNHEKKEILSFMTTIIQSHGIGGKFEESTLDENFDLLAQANDVIQEIASTYLDEAAGLKKSEEELITAVKPTSAINTSWNKKRYNLSSPQNYKLITAKIVTRPQQYFKDKIDNSNSPFVPIITEKPHSIKPLAIIYESDKDEFCHPYEWEIEKFTPQEEDLQTVEPVFPKPLEDTKFIFVKTEDELKKMCETLNKEKEIAVDLEHHSYRSFQGFTCLMQISTREEDYIIDTLALRNELFILNEIFANPKIVKVLHGADMDVQWLQRDFGVYIVNLFDTGQAARVLHFAHLSLAYLLKHYCKIDMDKQFQLADWRIRPLPEEMIKYAREDTHYLLYVYDCIKNDLIKAGNDMKNLLYSTIERSKMICSKKYQKPLFTEDKYLELYGKSKKVFNAKQLYCLKELYEWRDKIARENDDSLAYVLPNHIMLQIAEALPREQQGILSCCNRIPPFVKHHLNELHSIILKTNKCTLKELELLELKQKAQVTKSVHSNIDLNSLIHCPHDIHHLEDKKSQSFDQSGNAESLLPFITKKHASSSLLKEKPILSFTVPMNEKNIPEQVVNVLKTLISPYERYQITKQLQAKESSTKKIIEDTNSQVRKENIEISQEKNDSMDSAENNGSIVEEEDIEINDEKNTTAEISTPSALDDDIELAPLRKRRNKNKKRKSLTSSEPHGPPAKKISCSPVMKKDIEVVTVDDDDDDEFTPYDYSKADFSSFTGNKNKPNKEKNNKKKSKGYFGRKKKDFRQATFSQGSTNDHKSKWPKNK
ncbi:hypothetical protein CDAR_583751 [Caerostris darwini]|uniref:Exosome complex component 10 homolog n=1 Tax=Caerostris darwini TaxID=1538125 RepID=A0AAV4RHZ2_9ARAC|nr:hypothetical protein CDAR_583751 [Caerostris darwini]